MMGIGEVFAHFRWQDAVDILIVAGVIYWIILLLRGTRSLQMLIGLVLLILAFLISQKGRLMTMHWILNNFLSSVILIIVVIFQHDIRRALSTVGKNPFFSGASSPYGGPIVDEIIDAALSMARRKIGALVVLEKEAEVDKHVEVGVAIDGKVSKELISTIFSPPSPLHDGAILIQRGKLTAARCFLPLSANPRVLKTLGTRHRAALGLSEETDAVVIVVSEEKGVISLAIGGKLTRNLDAGGLRRVLYNLFVSKKKKHRFSLR
ncbi:MAG: diadenylate cyclase CdaA [Deltaproteobacteria bacterium]|nr:MAG: diadenylate cyclase CdaA [Deltaproteobacteria bacterium]